jgi:PLP dependent protein
VFWRELCESRSPRVRHERVMSSAQAQELLEKASLLPRDIKWHFIGQLQSNKCKMLVEGVPNLAVVESVDSVKLANKLNAASEAFRTSPLRVFVQVNTSAEPQKGGVEPGEAAALAKHIAESCPRLRLGGLMTIGKLGETASVFFDRLAEARRAVAEALGVEESSLELSMGMSHDFELAIACGATSVRVGSSIFGERAPKPATASAAASSS